MSRITQDQGQKRDTHFDNKAITFYGVAFQQLYLYVSFVTLLVNYVSILLPRQVLLPAVWASPFSLAATCGILVLVYFPPCTEMFHFHGFAT